MFEQIKGLTYNAFEATDLGIGFLEAADLITTQDTQNGEYLVLVLGMSITITSGTAGTMESDVPKQSTTKYEYATDSQKRQHKTEIIVDKQKKKIQSIVSENSEQGQKIAEVMQTVEQMKSEITEVADVSISADGYGSVSLDNINESEPMRIEIKPIGEDIAYLYPRDNLFPSDELFLKDRKIRFTNTTTNEYIDYELPDDLLYYDADNYDEFILDYDGQSCVVNKRVGYNADGSKYLLEKTKTVNYSYPTIPLKSGNYTVTLLGYPNAYLFVRLMVQSIYTEQFATKSEMKSQISQTVKEIDLMVAEKLSNYSTSQETSAEINLKTSQILSTVNNTLKSYSTTTQMNSAISQKANEITSTVSQTYETKENATTNYSQLKQTATSLQSQITANDTDISTMSQTVKEVNIEVGKKYNTSDFTNAKITAKLNDGTSSVKISADKLDLSATDIINLIAGNAINLTTKNITLTADALTIDKNGNITLKAEGTRVLKVENASNSKKRVYMTDEAVVVDTANYTGVVDIGVINDTDGIISVAKPISSTSATVSTITGAGITTPSVTQTSLESIKKNISESDINALEIIKNAKIYSYNLKTEKDTDKKHIGFVIGGNYKTPEEVIAKSGKGIDTYTMASLMWKALQESNAENEDLKQRIEKLEART